MIGRSHRTLRFVHALLLALAALSPGCNSPGAGPGDASSAADLGDASSSADLPAFCMKSSDCPPGKYCIGGLHGCPGYPVDFGGTDGGQCAGWGDKLGPSCETLDSSNVFDDIWVCQPSTDPVACVCRYEAGPGCWPL
jgi:hypothetical protein